MDLHGAGRNSGYDENGITPINDEDLDAVVGGYQVIFPNTGVNRDSWFVNYMTRRMLRDRIEEEMTAGAGVVPGEVTVRGRSYTLVQNGESIFVSEKP